MMTIMTMTRSCEENQTISTFDKCYCQRVGISVLVCLRGVFRFEAELSCLEKDQY